MNKIIALTVALGLLWGAISFQNLVTQVQIVRLSQQLQKLQQQNDDLQKIADALKAKQTSSPLPAQTTKAVKVVRGEASTYSEDGCLGCDSKLIMANGQRLDDDVATVAVACSFVNSRCYIPFKLGTRVRITNDDTGAATVATVTDTFGGIHGRVADLSKATATAINCKSKCQVRLSPQ